MPKTQKTERLILRALVTADAPWMTQAVNRPEIYRNVARIKPGQTQAETEAYINRVHEGEQADTDYVWMIEFEDERTGLIGLHRSHRGLLAPSRLLVKRHRHGSRDMHHEMGGRASVSETDRLRPLHRQPLFRTNTENHRLPALLAAAGLLRRS